MNLHYAVSEVLWENTTSAVSVQTNSGAAKERVMKPDFSGEWILDTLEMAERDGVGPIELNQTVDIGETGVV